MDNAGLMDKNCRFFVTNVTTEPHVDDPDNYLIFKAAYEWRATLFAQFFFISLLFKKKAYKRTT